MRHVRVDGSGKQVIIFLHGFMSTKEYWRRVIEQLDLTTYTAISIDLLGFNKAPKPDVEYTYDDHVGYIRSVLQELELVDTPIIITGHSMGALIATRYANTYPEHIESVGLINPPIYANPLQAKSTLLATGPHYRLFLASKYRGLLWAMGRYIGAFPKHSANSREKSLESVIIAAEFLEDIARLSVKTILTIGMKDRYVYQDSINSVNTQRTPLNIYIDNTGHHAALTHPNLVAKYIKQLAA